MDVVSITLAKRMENSEQGAQFMHNKSGTLRQASYL